jgi:quinol-cytochrome oxidoreductase complex cytochrome b subunit
MRIADFGIPLTPPSPLGERGRVRGRNPKLIGGRNSMENDNQKVFIKDPNKTYGMMEIVDGTSPMVEKPPEDTVETFPNYIILLTLSSLAVIFVLFIFSLFFDAPLEDLANPFVTPNPGKAPWYFTGIQELIHYTNKPVIPAIIIPLLIVLWLFLIPYIDRKPQTRFTSLFNRIFIGGEKRKVLIILFTLFVFGVLTFTVIGSLFRGENWGFVLPWK